MGQAVACAPVTQRARVRSPVRTSFLGEVFFGEGFSSPVRQMSGSFRPPRSPNIIWPSLLSSVIIHYGLQWPEMLTHPKTSNIHTFKKAVPIHLLIIRCFISLEFFSRYKWLYHFIITQVIFRHFFSVGIGNELLRVWYNFNYPTQSTKFILSKIFTEWNISNWGYVSDVTQVWRIVLLANITKVEKLVI